MNQPETDVSRFAIYIALVAVGMLAGAAAVAFLLNPVGFRILTLIFSGFAVLGLGAVLFAVFSRIWLARLSEQWSATRATRLFNGLLEAARDPATFADALERNRAEVAELARMGLSFFVATRSLAVVGMALGAVVSVATLLTAYIQIERLTEQNRLINIQNSLAEASRRASLNFELSNILNALDNKQDADQLLISRVSALSRSLRPYRLLQDDGSLSDPLSPERAQLLLSLLASGVDMARIGEAGATFAYADLRGADLSGQKLVNVELSNADLRGANLSATSLVRVNLSSSKLPAVAKFTPTEFEGLDISGATTTEPDWLANFIKGLGYPVAARSRTADRTSSHGVIILADREPLTVGMDVSVIAVSRSRLSSAASWRQTEDGKLVSDQRAANLSSWLESVDAEIAAEPSVTPDEIVANNLPRLDDFISEADNFRISTSTRLIGLPELADVFEFLAPYGLFPARARFDGISPGGMGKPVSVLAPDGAGAQPQRPDLRNADFSFADLRYVRFGRSDLSGANFSGALLPPYEYFKYAELSSADFTNAVLPHNWPDSVIDPEKYMQSEQCETIYDSEIGQQVEGRCITIVRAIDQ
ncbi:pentapeptide repeat-containing protein [Hoeflea poritis]|uniref:Pentapeptide repeat-containing protein n=1 Tax=Hoeflea poritis TaxID=2993659 RepID=A0ABT4VRY4_9HYPH|nr:pentapeptide repeat-containing protein [Hoeflea poritis]MDA4847475.1 pentapeptide repeat-containing protein [Hoeflea poritis]